MVGTSVLHFHILERLGEGGMGVVYRARNTRLDRTVALKFLPHHQEPGNTGRAQFVQGACAEAASNDPNICSIYAIHEDQGRQFIEFEYVDGESLRQMLERGARLFDPQRGTGGAGRPGQIAR